MTEKGFTFHITEYDEVVITEEKTGREFYLGNEEDIDIDSVDGIVGKLNEQHETIQQLQGDCTTLVYSNQEYRQENENLKKQLDYIQNSINEHIKHQKTELGVKALQEIIADYNEWMLGHKEVKE